jgi:NADPH:quinone reductase-like Zn-dependent oxidoreductase
MKAIVQERYGSHEVLHLGEIAKPIAGDNEILIRVVAAGVGPDVWHFMTGRPYLVRIIGFGFFKPKAAVRGSDLAGIVEAVGTNVTKFQIGDEVFGNCDGARMNGAFAEYAVAKENRIARKPTNISFEQAAAIPISANTALLGLRGVGQLKAGQKVAIIGAGGGVGSFAVQIANSIGAEVTGICSTSKMELVRSIGATHVVDYTAEDFVDGLNTYDLILDTAGRRSLKHLSGALKPDGVIAIVGGEGGGKILGGFGRQIFVAPFKSMFSTQKFRAVTLKTEDTDFDTLTKLVESGAVTPVIDSTYSLATASDAVKHLAEGHAAGKIILMI